jgi:hypothetical protein
MAVSVEPHENADQRIDWRGAHTHLPLVGCCLDSLWFGSAEDHVLEGIRATLQNVDEPGRLEPDRAERWDGHPAELVALLAPASEIFWSQRAGPGDVVIQADLMLDFVTVEDILRDKCQVSDTQLMSEFLGELARQSNIARLAEAHSSAGQEPVTEAVHRT